MSEGSIALRTESSTEACESLQEFCGFWTHSKSARSRSEIPANADVLWTNRGLGWNGETSDVPRYFYSAFLQRLGAVSYRWVFLMVRFHLTLALPFIYVSLSPSTMQEGVIMPLLLAKTKSAPSSPSTQNSLTSAPLPGQLVRTN